MSITTWKKILKDNPIFLFIKRCRARLKTQTDLQQAEVILGHNHVLESDIDPRREYNSIEWFQLNSIEHELIKFSTDFVGTDITGEVEYMLDEKGHTSVYYRNVKYLKAGESKTSVLFRCHLYSRKCKSRININKKTDCVSKNEIEHQHDLPTTKRVRNKNNKMNSYHE